MIYRKIHALFLTLALMLALLAGLCAQPPSVLAVPAPASPGDLLSALPPSDLIVYLDAQRTLADAMPAFLATKPEALTKINAEIDKLKNETGIDLRTFDMVVAGLSFGGRAGQPERMVFLARGRFDSSAVINAGFAAAAKEKNNSFRKQQQEDYKGKLIYTFGPSPSKGNLAGAAVISQPAANTSAERPAAKLGDKQPTIVEVPREKSSDRGQAVTALDGNTLAAGDLGSVRAAIDASAGGAHVDDEMVQLATRNTSALLGFSTKRAANLFPHGAAVGNEEPFMKSLQGVQQVFGSVSVSGTDMDLSFSLRMETAEQARGLREMVNIAKAEEEAKLQGRPADSTPPFFMSLLRKLNVTVEDKEVQVQLKMAQEEVPGFFPRF
jgi:hypothetical protein